VSRAPEGLAEGVDHLLRAIATKVYLRRGLGVHLGDEKYEAATEKHGVGVTRTFIPRTARISRRSGRPVGERTYSYFLVHRLPYPWFTSEIDVLVLY
jgi:hypothetical protein